MNQTVLYTGVNQRTEGWALPMRSQAGGRLGEMDTERYNQNEHGLTPLSNAVFGTWLPMPSTVCRSGFLLERDRDMEHGFHWSAIAPTRAEACRQEARAQVFP